MEVQRIIKFMRITFQGICVASLGTMGLTPSWGAVTVGVGCLLASLTLLVYEKER